MLWLRYFLSRTQPPTQNPHRGGKGQQQAQCEPSSPCTMPDHGPPPQHPPSPSQHEIPSPQALPGESQETVPLREENRSPRRLTLQFNEVSCPFTCYPNIPK